MADALLMPGLPGASVAVLGMAVLSGRFLGASLRHLLGLLAVLLWTSLWQGAIDILAQWPDVLDAYASTEAALAILNVMTAAVTGLLVLGVMHFIADRLPRVASGWVILSAPLFALSLIVPSMASLSPGLFGFATVAVLGFSGLIGFALNSKGRR